MQVVIAERDAEHPRLLELQLGVVIFAALLMLGNTLVLLLHWRGRQLH